MKRRISEKTGGQCDNKKKCIKSKIMPSNTVGWFSYLTVSWLTDLMNKACAEGLDKRDLWDLHEEDRSLNSSSNLQQLWSKEKSTARTKAKLSRAVWIFVKKRACAILLISIFFNIFQFIGPAILLKRVLEYGNESENDPALGVLLIFAVLIVNLLKGALYHLAHVLSNHLAITLSGGIQCMVYTEMLKSLPHGTTQDSISLTSVITSDVNTLVDACCAIVFLTSGPMLFMMHALYGAITLGSWALVGMFIFLLSYPLINWLTNSLRTIKKKQLKKTDMRLSLISEIIDNIKSIKVNYWESLFLKKVSRQRDCEVDLLKVTATYDVLFTSLIPFVSTFATVSTLVTFTLAGLPICSVDAFTISSIFNAMEFTVSIMPFTLKKIYQANISLVRIQSVLDVPKYEKQFYIKNKSSVYALRLKEAKFIIHYTNPYLQKKKNSSDLGVNDDCLGSISKLNFRFNFKINRGTLNGICGSTASGKSSFVSAITGELKLESGRIQVLGNISLVSQQSWLFNSSIRNNIIVGRPFIALWYQKIIDACLLTDDLELLPEGDLTQVKDSGTNLSGGQKQRIHLARAVYGNSDIFLLDDPLSAVDYKVSKDIFHSCFKKLLLGKTILLITHNVSFLEQCDKILVMKDYEVVETGFHKSLISKKEEYWKLIHSLLPKQGNTATEKRNLNNKMEDTNVTTSNSMEGHEYFVKSEIGSVWPNFEALGGWRTCFFVLALVLWSILMKLFHKMWLRKWLEHEGPDNFMYQIVFVLTFIFYVGSTVIKGMKITGFMLKCATYLHKEMLSSILTIPLALLDKIPSSQILNRFSSDMAAIDSNIPIIVDIVLTGILSISIDIIIACYLFPLFAVPLGVILYLYSNFEQRSIKGTQQLKKFENETRSSVLQHFIDSAKGKSTIRTLNRELFFIKKFHELVDNHSACKLLFRLSNRWLTYRIDLLAALLTTVITTLCIFSKGYLSTATIGLALTNVNGICAFLPFLIRKKVELQGYFTSVERIIDYGHLSKYCEERNQGGLNQTPQNLKNKLKSGSLVFKDVSIRYQKDSPFILKGITLSIKDGEKIGIIGRTGSGKSSLFLALLRLIKIGSGVIQIGRYNIEDLNLEELRTSICMVSQDPVFFTGSVKFNIDPHDEFTDDQVWNALEKVHIKTTIENRSSGLQSQVGVSGRNFSAGERQLLSLARALLKNRKIILLDEVTCSLDSNTNVLIQETIRKAFSKSTVLTIAHKHETVISYDRIIVLCQGNLFAFDSPERLKSKGLFSVT